MVGRLTRTQAERTLLLLEKTAGSDKYNFSSLQLADGAAVVVTVEYYYRVRYTPSTGKLDQIGLRREQAVDFLMDNELG